MKNKKGAQRETLEELDRLAEEAAKRFEVSGVREDYRSAADEALRVFSEEFRRANTQTRKRAKM